MGKNKQNNKTFGIPDPHNTLKQLSSKYSFGDKANKLNEIKKQRPVFAFDYISLNKTDFCFNSNIGQKDYHKLFQGLKTISGKSYDELSSQKVFHFHEVNFDDITIHHSDFLKCLVPDARKINADHSPTVYQFKPFEEARIFGFVSNMVFYLVFFDRWHKAYERK